MCDKHHFEFEIDLAIRQQVIQKLEASPAHPLVLSVAPPETGVYTLYRNAKLVYAGKALATNLKTRLGQHYRKIESRQNIRTSEMTCRYLEIKSDWFVRAAEDALISNYNPEWNASGFGSHSPGRGRPGIRVSPFDTSFPPKPGVDPREGASDDT
ncbi:MAG: Eco29kI family restriction endonuclease [Nitrososphaerota archaeon]|nr:Eco29kI family restriction endonuclease [Nitrososphaerota archaeon]